jgi:hypothetical protein
VRSYREMGSLRGLASIPQVTALKVLEALEIIPKLRRRSDLIDPSIRMPRKTGLSGISSTIQRRLLDVIRREHRDEPRT